MSSFEFRKDQLNKDWVIIAPKRAKRPDVAAEEKPICPFCPGHEKMTPPELFRVGRGKGNKKSWEIRITSNKFPFAPIHEVVIHTPDHSESFFTFSTEKLKRIFYLYQQRYLTHEGKGQIVIFHNFGKEGAESLPHSHTQIAVVPNEIVLKVPLMGSFENVFKETKHFVAFCPETSQWPSEVWIGPKKRGNSFGYASKAEIEELAKVFKFVLKKLEKTFKNNFPFNFYIYPGGDWYLRIIPRKKTLGGFELATDVYVNTTEPKSAAKNLSR